ncbi:MAG: TonB-dependent receptor [Synergistaceae bacterium]|jgi:outer membrane receptor protein involved in Fe transport|nr:TonB-dependent receptor [Synergistaceae bacterium]
MFRRIAVLVFLAASLLPARAGAAPVELEEEFVSASALEEDRDRSPGSVTVVRAEELKGEMPSLPDMLERVPGLHVVQARGRGAYTVASIRGSTSSQVSVYVDGVLQNLGSEAAVDLSAIPVSEVERVEVYRGYIPARFSEAGLGGVVNIVTRAPEDGERTTLTAGIGSLGAVRTGLAHSRSLGGGRFLAALNHEGSAGDFSYRNDNGTPYNPADDYDAVRKNNERSMTDLLLKWEDERWNARLAWSRDDRDLPASAPGMDKPDSLRGARLDTGRWDAALSRRWVVPTDSGRVEWGLRAEWMKQDKKYDNPDNMLGGLGERHNEYRAERFSGALDASWAPKAWGGRHFFEAIVSGSGETLDAAGDIVTRLGGKSRFSQESWRAALQDSIALTESGSLLLTPSLRWDRSGEDSETSWAVAATYQPTSAWTFKATYGRYARAPNLYERYGDGATIRPAEDLRWETGTQWDAGFVWNNLNRAAPERGPSLTVSATYFGRKTDDLIEFIMTSPRFGIYENIAKSQAHGVELEARADWKLWRVSLAATWMRAENETAGNYRNGKRLPNAPQWAGTARLTRVFPDGKGEAVRASAFVEGQFTGDNYLDQNELVRYDNLLLLNAGIKWNIRENLDMTFGVYDVLDNGPDVKLRAVVNGPDRMSWYPLPGRGFYMTLIWSF